MISRPQYAPAGLPNPAEMQRLATAGCTRSPASHYGVL